jgi:hypothetical protein
MFYNQMSVEQMVLDQRTGSSYLSIWHALADDVEGIALPEEILLVQFLGSELVPTF